MKLKGLLLKARFKATKTTFTELLTEEVNIPLTQAQQAVYEPIQEAMNSHEHKTFLLHGVTGSGKTQLYLRATANVLVKIRLLLSWCLKLY